MLNVIRNLITHGMALVIGIALGIYLLPILIAPDGPTESAVKASSEQAVFRGMFRRDLAGSDFLHWGEGELGVSSKEISFNGDMAPGPDYQLYLTEALVQDEASFLEIKANAVKIGPVKTFDRFILSVPAGVDPTRYRAVVVWCESFSEFITAASYR